MRIATFGKKGELLKYTRNYVDVLGEEGKCVEAAFCSMVCLCCTGNHAYWLQKIQAF